MRIFILVIGAALLSTVSASAQDAAAGEKVFAQCKACHQIGETAKNAVGPKLNGLFGRKSGTIEGFNYSPANKNSGITWDEATFREYIKDPKAKVPGTKMTFPGLKDPKQIDDIVAYLKQFDSAGKKAEAAPSGERLAKVQILEDDASGTYDVAHRSGEADRAPSKPPAVVHDQDDNRSL